MRKISLKLILKYYWEAKTIFSAHSPFVYDFMKNILANNADGAHFKAIEKKRSELLQSKVTIPFIEYGAGTAIGRNNSERKIADIARNSLSGRWQCRIMYNLIKQYKLAHILEIGTSLGISTAYLAKANASASIITLEGNPDSARIARDLWKDLDLAKIEVRIGEFGDTLSQAARDLRTIDMAFLDGNHRKQATLDYFNLLKPHASEKSVFVIDDIYWSHGMNEAWNEIIQDSAVAFSIDLFRMGIVFFDHTIMPKQHFKLIPYKFKPWAIGIFG
jgi:predicted O-methyltransferase YrrM